MSSHVSRRRAARAIMVALAGFVMLPGLCPVSADAHIKKGDEWYFIGRTFKDKDDKPGDVKDPVNWIFHGGGGNITNSRVADHVETHWRFGDMRDRFCKDDQRMVWRDLRGGSKSDKQDRHRMTDCFHRQYHTRLWDDYEHSLITHHRRYSWVVGGLHHEKPVAKFNFKGFKRPPGCCATHKIDRGWNRVRHEGVMAMRYHCTQFRWRMHPGARKKLQGFRNSGWIARISMRHRLDGCKGA